MGEMVGSGERHADLDQLCKSMALHNVPERVNESAAWPDAVLRP